MTTSATEMHALPTDKATSSTQVTEHASSAMKKYNIYYTASRCNARLHLGAASTTATYYMRSGLADGRLLLELRRGAAKTSPMVAFAQLPNTSRHMHLARGDRDHDPEGQIVWEKIYREKNVLKRSDYQFGVEEEGRRREYVWRKDMGKCGKTVYDAVDEEGRVVGRLLSGGMFNWSKGGEIEVVEEMGEAGEEWMLISALAIWTLEAFNYQSLTKGYGDDKDKEKDK